MVKPEDIEQTLDTEQQLEITSDFDPSIDSSGDSNNAPFTSVPEKNTVVNKQIKTTHPSNPSKTYSYLIEGMNADTESNNIPIRDYILSGNAVSWSQLDEQEPWLKKLIADEKSWTFHENDKAWSASYPVSDSSESTEHSWYVVVKSDISWHEEMQKQIRDRVLSDTSGSSEDEQFRDYYNTFSSDMPIEYDNSGDAADIVENEIRYSDHEGTYEEAFGVPEYTQSDAILERINLAETNQELIEQINNNTNENQNTFGRETDETISPRNFPVPVMEQTNNDGVHIEYIAQNQLGDTAILDEKLKTAGIERDLSGLADRMMHAMMQEDRINQDMQATRDMQTFSQFKYPVQEMLGALGSIAQTQIAMFSMEREAEATKWLLEASKNSSVTSPMVSNKPDIVEMAQISGIAVHNEATNVNSFFHIKEDGSFDTVGLDRFIDSHEKFHGEKLDPYMLHEVRAAAQTIGSDISFRDIVNQNTASFDDSNETQKMIEYINSDEYLKHTNLLYESKLLDAVVQSDIHQNIIAPKLQEANSAIASRIHAFSSDGETAAVPANQKNLDILKEASLTNDISVLEHLKKTTTDGRSNEVIGRKIFMLKVDGVNDIDQLKSMLPGLKSEQANIIKEKITHLQISRTTNITDLQKMLQDTRLSLHQKRLINAKIKQLNRRDILEKGKHLSDGVKSFFTAVTVTSLTSADQSGVVTRAMSNKNKMMRMLNFAKDTNQFIISFRSRISPEFAQKQALIRVRKEAAKEWRKEHSLSAKTLRGMNKVTDGVGDLIGKGVTTTVRGISAPIRGAGRLAAQTKPVQGLIQGGSNLKGQIDTALSGLKKNTDRLKESFNQTKAGKALQKANQGRKAAGRAAKKGVSVAGKTAKGVSDVIGGIGIIFKKLKVILVIGVLIAIALMIGLMSINYIISLGMGMFSSVLTIVDSDEEALPWAIDGGLDVKGLLKLEDNRYKEAYELATGKPVTSDVAFYNEIDTYGHPENTDGINTEEAYRGWEIYYVREDETKENEDKEKLQLGHSNLNEILAMAAAMFHNEINTVNSHAFTTLCSDLWDLTHPKMQYTESDMYVNEYMGDSDYEYYCNQPHHYNNFNTIAEQGGKVYGMPVPQTEHGCEVDYEAYRTAYARWQNEEPSLYDSKYLDSEAYRTARSNWFNNPPQQSDYIDWGYYNGAYNYWRNQEPQSSSYYDYNDFLTAWYRWQDQKPNESDYIDQTAYNRAYENWRLNPPNPDDFRNRTAWQTDHNNWERREPKEEDFMYCPGHTIKVCYGHRDITIYLPVLSMEDVFEQNLYPSGLSAFFGVYDNDIAEFINEGGWNNPDNVEYARILATSPLFDVYGLDLISSHASATGVKYTESEQHALGSSIDYSDVSTTSKNTMRFAVQCIGKIPFSDGASAEHKNFNDNHFGETADEVIGLGGPGFIEYVLWQGTNDPEYLGGLSFTYEDNGEDEEPTPVIMNGHAEEIKYSDLKTGDLGVDFDPEIAVYNAAFYAGQDEDGNDLWLFMSPVDETVVIECTNHFTRYYRISY